MITETYIFKEHLIIPKGTIIEGFTPCGEIGIPQEIKIPKDAKLMVRYDTIDKLKWINDAALYTKIEGDKTLGVPMESPYIDHIIKLLNAENTVRYVEEDDQHKFKVFRRNSDGREGNYLTYVIAENEKQAQEKLDSIYFSNCIIRR